MSPLADSPTPCSEGNATQDFFPDKPTFGKETRKNVWRWEDRFFRSEDYLKSNVKLDFRLHCPLF